MFQNQQAAWRDARTSLTDVHLPPGLTAVKAEPRGDSGLLGWDPRSHPPVNATDHE